MPKPAPQKTDEAKPQKPHAKVPAKKTSLFLFSPLTVLVAIGIGAAAGGTCMGVGCFSFLEDTPLPPIPTLPVFSPIALRTPQASPLPSPSASGAWGAFLPGVSEFDPLRDAPEASDGVALEVPFTSQAPLGGTWTELHEEACEEASMLMAEAYVRRKGEFAKQATDRALRDFVSWQERNGYGVDLTAAEMARVMGDYLSLQAKAYSGSEVTADNIRRLLSAGYPVIIPVAGKQLRNPYFTPPGPDYHVLVLVGYDSDGFIANDPGTRRGAKYRYSEGVIMNAIHDWTGDKKTVPEGPKAMVVVQKEA